MIGLNNVILGVVEGLVRMRMTKILWLAVPLVFLLVIGVAIIGPGRKPQPEVKGRIIVVQANPSDPEDIERARKKANEIHELLKTGANFAELAGSKSEALSASHRGDMGWIGKGVLPKNLEDVLFKLEPGQFSEIIMDIGGESVVFRILYVEERRNF